MDKPKIVSAGLAAGFLGLVALTPSAYPQYQEPQTFWNGAPSAPGPGMGNGPAMYAPGPGQYAYSPNYGGWAPGYGGNNMPSAGPYWLGAPGAPGPGM
jgi:hypothetical protein